MELTPYVNALRRDLATASEAASEETRDAAQRLSFAVEPSLRLVLLDALSEAADEVTDQLSAAVVEVRLRGRDPELVVTESVPHPPEPPAPPAPPAAPPPPDADEGTARISLRLPDSLKTRVEEAAASDGLSVNAWLVRAVSAALDDSTGSGAFIETPGVRIRVGKRMTGWQR